MLVVVIALAAVARKARAALALRAALAPRAVRAVALRAALAPRAAVRAALVQKVARAGSNHVSS